MHMQVLAAVFAWHHAAAVLCRVRCAVCCCACVLLCMCHAVLCTHELSERGAGHPCSRQLPIVGSGVLLCLMIWVPCVVKQLDLTAVRCAARLPNSHAYAALCGRL